ncbi:MAG: M42 family metallopeptidase [Candidatus Hodarchaeota archaeon]
MRPESVDLLKRLVETPSPSGFEQPVQRIVREELAKYVDDVRTDVIGNVIGIHNESGRPRVMIAGHCDEIGLMVQYIDDNGFIYFTPIGGVDAHLTPGQRVRIHSKQRTVLGVIGKKPIHRMKPIEMEKVVELSKQWIDIGAKNKETAETRVSVGDPITFDVQFEPLGSNDLVVSRGFDDKVGTFTVIETLRLLVNQGTHSAAVFGVSSVQEEVGLRGATISAFEIRPDVGIAIDVEFATDNPSLDKKEIGDISLGKGPVVCRGSRSNPIVEGLLIQVAQQEKIPYQLSAYPSRTETDADVIQMTRAGVATAILGIPNRYMHTPCEVVSLDDLENTSKLLAAFIHHLNETMSFIPQ